MEYIISREQKEKIVNTIQRYVDSEMEDLKKLADNDELSYDENDEVSAIEYIKVVDVEKKEGWVISVDIYKNTNRYSFSDVLYHLYYQLKKHIGMNSVNERNVIDVREFGPGIDF